VRRPAFTKRPPTLGGTSLSAFAQQNRALVAHLARVYQMRLRPANNTQEPWRLMGSIDGGGTKLVRFLEQVFPSMHYPVEVAGQASAQGTGPVAVREIDFARSVSCPTPNRTAAIFNHHRFGDRGVLNLHRQGNAIPFEEEDDHQVEVGVLVHADPAQSCAFLAFHVANGRSIKKGIEHQLKKCLKDSFNLLVEFRPVVPAAAVTEALEKYGSREIIFRKLSQPSGSFSNDSEWWEDDDELGSVNVHLKSAKKSRLPASKLVEYFRRFTTPSISGGTGRPDQDGEPVSFRDVATFADVAYDEIVVELYIGGKPRKVRVTEAGYAVPHAFSWELDVERSPSDIELVLALGEVILPPQSFSDGSGSNSIGFE
jgi:hypothetical protein